MIRVFVLALIGMTMLPPNKSDESNLNKRRNYLSIVDSLASENKPPKFSERGAIVSDDFDWSEQARIAKALLELSPKTQDEWVVLIRNREDSRYCISGYEQTPKSPKNYSIAQICKEVARVQVFHPVLSVFEKHEVSIPRSHLLPELKESLFDSQVASIRTACDAVGQLRLKNSVSASLKADLEKLDAELTSEKIGRFYEYSWDNFTWLAEKHATPPRQKKFPK